MAIVPECVPALMASNAPLIVVYDAAPVPPVAMTLTWAEAAVETMTARPNAMRWMALRMIPPKRLDGQAAAWNGPLRSPALSGGDGRKRGEC